MQRPSGDDRGENKPSDPGSTGLTDLEVVNMNRFRLRFIRQGRAPERQFPSIGRSTRIGFVPSIRKQLLQVASISRTV
jgi:hypothetical protein